MEIFRDFNLKGNIGFERNPFAATLYCPGERIFPFLSFLSFLFSLSFSLSLMEVRVTCGARNSKNITSVIFNPERDDPFVDGDSACSAKRKINYFRV